MSLAEELVYEEGITYAFGATHNKTLPKAENIKAIVLRCNMGALSGGASGSFINNTSLQSIKIRLNGRLIIDFDGLKDIDGQISMGIATLREFYKQMYQVAMANEHFIIEFPNPLPKNSEVQIIFTTASDISSIQTSGGDRDTLAASTIDVLYRTGKAVANPRIPFISWTTYSHAARTGNLDEYVPNTSLPLRKIMLITYDGTTIADDTYDSLLLQEGSKVHAEGNLTHLRGTQEAKSHVAQSTGHLHIGFPRGKTVKSSTLKIQFRASTAGTAKFVHFAYLAYA